YDSAQEKLQLDFWMAAGTSTTKSHRASFAAYATPLPRGGSSINTSVATCLLSKQCPKRKWHWALACARTFSGASAAQRKSVKIKIKICCSFRAASERSFCSSALSGQPPGPISSHLAISAPVCTASGKPSSQVTVSKIFRSKYWEFSKI